MVVGGSLEPVPWGRIGKLARYILTCVHVGGMYILNLLPSFLFFGICTRVYCIFFRHLQYVYAIWAFSISILFFLFFCWIARSQAAMRNVQYLR